MPVLARGTTMSATVHQRFARAALLAITAALALAVAGTGAVADASGVSRIKDIQAGTKGSAPKLLTRVGDTVYFTAATNKHGRELWKTKGWIKSTKLVKDIKKGTGSATPTGLINAGGTLYFRVGKALWRSRGTAASTKQLKFTGVANFPMAAVGKKLYFRTSTGLWVTQGTTASTRQVSTVKIRGPIHAAGGTLYFGGYDADHGLELWKSDGSHPGTKRVTDIRPGPTSSIIAGEYAYANIGSTLFFRAMPDELYGYSQLFKSDGTSAGTKRLTYQYEHAPELLTPMGGVLYYRGNDDDHTIELWRSDGTVDGTKIVKDIHPGGGAHDSSHPKQLTVVGDLLFFAADDDAHGQELWKSDGTTPGTVLVKDIKTDNNALMSNFVRVTDDILFFSAWWNNKGVEPGMSKGTPATTKRIADVRVGRKSSMRNCTTCAVVLGKKVIFAAETGKHGMELWRWTR
jgi:ELWxxDGT repeat protein